MISRTSFAVLTALGLIAAGGAQALTISDNFVTPSNTTDLQDETGTLSQFDALANGTLTSVTLEVSAHSDSTTSLTNTAAQSQTFSYLSTLDFLFSSSNADLSAALSGTILTNTLADTGGFITLASGGVQDLGQRVEDGVASVTLGPADAAFSAFLGTGSFDVICNTFTGSSFRGGGGNINTDQVTTAQCDATVTYTYDPAPPPSVALPGSLLLLSAGMFGFGATRRRK